MELITKVDFERSSFRITYDDHVMFLGSCFAAEMGSMMQEGRMPVMINPAGTVYNPVSVATTLKNVISGTQTGADDLFYHEGTWLSFSHYTEFSGPDKDEVLERINTRTAASYEFLRKATVLFITFGTARIFRLSENGAIVSNCHKLPRNYFTRELLTVNNIVNQWQEMLDQLALFNPDLKVVFTISPVRHWKDGAHGNQVSKAILLLSVEELSGHHTHPGYFPAYEIMMDELRDYRFYAGDMLHPSDKAVDYIREAFMECYFDNTAVATWKEASKITMAARHRITGSGKKVQDFAKNMLSKISRLEASVKGIDFSEEKKYFENILSL